MEALLRCRLITRNIPYLMLQPVKVEEQSLDPTIVVLHDLLTERQTEILRQLGEPKVIQMFRIFYKNSKNQHLQLKTSMHRGSEGFVRSMIRTSKK